MEDIAAIVTDYDAYLFELTIFRLLETERQSDRGRIKPTESGWVSELWHSDNYPPHAFKIIIYLSDVGDSQSPFEYKDPVEYVPWNPRLGWEDTRYPYACKSKKVTGPRGQTIIFKNNIVHKGNYCREGYRDVVMIGLALRGPFRRVCESVKRWLKR
ncbi:MAG: hypothetical protein O7C75_15680 [Verrucomicrobia bacterium]|nr:hypothetical protein [Verrucomicrobiota bacterium]